MITFDGTLAPDTVAPPAAKPVVRVPAPSKPALPPQPETAPAASSASAAGMIFLFRDDSGWRMQLNGVSGVDKLAERGPTPIPFDRAQTLRTVLEWIGKTYNGKLAGCWLMVAP